ncbi:MAG: DUF2400 family protein [Planctomycetota bacterium]|jgi:hypothetical protein
MADRQFLEDLYSRYNRREHARHDPVRFLYAYEDIREREVAGLIAASLAYGQLRHILKSVADVLGRLQHEPRRFILSATPRQLCDACVGFRHRLVNEDRLWRFLLAVREVLQRHGSLEACFASHDAPSSPTILPGLIGLAGELAVHGQAPAHLVARPEKGSACKRWNLYLSRRLGLTQRKVCNLRAAMEITESFRRVSPADPVKYDFALMHASLEEGRTLKRVLLDSNLGGS